MTKFATFVSLNGLSVRSLPICRHAEVSIADDFADFVRHLRPMDEREPLIVTVGGQPQYCYPEGRAKLIHEVRAFLLWSKS